ncbi:MAG: discoidin domain-containing protein, partial [Opitutae bacterium]|nr:discoidin domain-containing protein [Opitutae bacterium]
MRHLLLSPGIIGLFLITLVDAANVTRVSSSSAQDGNTATQALNSGSSSRWSAEGRGQWMQLDLDAPATVASVEVGFQRGNRNYSFEIQVSSDGRKWRSILDTKSSGKGDGVESFKTQPAEGRFIRLVSNGNNENQWINLHTFR